MEKAGLPVDERLVIDAGFQYEGGLAAASHLLDLDCPPTAVFGASDSMAVGLMNGLRRRGVRVPDDISVAGANDDLYAVYVEPPLTTVRVPVAAAVRRAAEIVLAAIGSSGAAPPVHEVLDVELVVRSSTQPLKI